MLSDDQQPSGSQRRRTPAKPGVLSERFAVMKDVEQENRLERSGREEPRIGADDVDPWQPREELPGPGHLSCIPLHGNDTPFRITMNEHRGHDPQPCSEIEGLADALQSGGDNRVNRVEEDLPPGVLTELKGQGGESSTKLHHLVAGETELWRGPASRHSRGHRSERCPEYEPEQCPSRQEVEEEKVDELSRRHRSQGVQVHRKKMAMPNELPELRSDEEYERQKRWGRDLKPQEHRQLVESESDCEKRRNRDLKTEKRAAADQNADPDREPNAQWRSVFVKHPVPQRVKVRIPGARPFSRRSRWPDLQYALALRSWSARPLALRARVLVKPRIGGNGIFGDGSRASFHGTYLVPPRK